MSETNFDSLLSEREVRATAELALLEVDEAGLHELTAALRALLAHFEIIARVEAEAGGGSGSPVERRATLAEAREDEAITTDREPLLEAAPDFEEELFFVPRMMG